MATKVFSAGLAVTLVLVALMLVIGSPVYHPIFMLRRVFWLGADAYDHQRFPARRLQAGRIAFRFRESRAADQVRGLFESTLDIDNFEELLDHTGTQAFLVIQDDTILYESYFHGASRDTIVTSFSIAKSFTSALIGIAIQEGHIGSVYDPITVYLPELADRDSDFEEITIRDLLLMSSGIQYAATNFFTGDDALTYYYPDLRQLALEETRIVASPGWRFRYNNYHPLLLGIILERVTGKSVSRYLEEKIWIPLGMEYDGSWSLDSQASGFEKMESGINARAIDFAKFGRLFLHEGTWDGEQIVPKEWVIESTGPDHTIDPVEYFPDWHFFASGRGYYKYFWWGLHREQTDYDFFAEGNHGQFIYISPQKDLIIVRNGERYGLGPSQWVDIFYKFATVFDPEA